MGLVEVCANWLGHLFLYIYIYIYIYIIAYGFDLKLRLLKELVSLF
jgi:hypothetical protein